MTMTFRVSSQILLGVQLPGLVVHTDALASFRFMIQGDSTGCGEEANKFDIMNDAVDPGPDKVLDLDNVQVTAVGLQNGEEIKASNADELGHIATGVNAVEKSEEDQDQMLRGLLLELFDRYDVDASGTLNSSDELKQLTMNVMFKLGGTSLASYYLYSPEHVIAKVEAVCELTDENAWYTEEYITWFHREFPRGE